MGHTGLMIHSSRAPDAVVSAEESGCFGHHGAGDKFVGEPFIDWIRRHLDCLAEWTKRMERLEGREIEREARFDVSNTCTFLDLGLRYHGSATSRVTIDMISIQVRVKRPLGHDQWMIWEIVLHLFTRPFPW